MEGFRETLTRAEPDVLVMVGSDHFHQLWLDNMPQFLVGHAEQYDANWYNEEREFGLPRCTCGRRASFGAHPARGPRRRFDLAFSNELRIDHSVTCPIITLRPQNDLPIVPIYTNIFAPPLPRPYRFVQLGTAIRELVEAWPRDKRVAVIAPGTCRWSSAARASSGRTGRTRSSTPRRSVDRGGDVEGCLAEVTLDSLHAPGNATHGFMDFMLMMGVAGAGGKADYVDASTSSTRWRRTSPGTRRETPA